MNTQRRFRGITILLIVAAVVLISQVAGNLRRAGDISYGEMRSCFVQEKVKSFTASDERLTAVLQDDSTVTCALQSFDTFYSDLNDLVVEQADKGIITSYNYTPGNTTNWLSTLLPYVLAVMAFILLMNLIARTGGGGAVNDKMARFGEARIQDIPDDGKKVTFKDGRRRRGEGGAPGDRGVPEKSKEVYRSGRPDPQGRAAGGPSGHRQDAACQGGGRRGRRGLPV